MTASLPTRHVVTLIVIVTAGTSKHGCPTRASCRTLSVGIKLATIEPIKSGGEGNLRREGRV